MYSYDNTKLAIFNLYFITVNPILFPLSLFLGHSYDNDLANVSSGMSTKEVDLSSKNIEFISKSAVGAVMGSLAGDIVGSFIGATQFRKYVLDTGVKSNSIIGAIINDAVAAGCSVFGGVIGFAVGAVTSNI